MQRGLGPLGFGLALGPQENSAEVIYPIGTLLVGELLEYTAVPELREQAQQVAERVLARLAQREISPRRTAWFAQPVIATQEDHTITN